MNAKSRASFMGAVFLLPFLSACSVGSDDPANSATIGCGDPAVMAGASEKLAEWFDQNVINRPGRNLQVTAKLVVGVSASVAGPSRHSRLFVSADGTHSTIAGDPSGSQRCAVYFSVGFRDADDTLFTGLVQQSFTTEFLLVSGPNGPQVTLDDPYNFMLDTGQFSELLAILEQEAQREESSESAKATPVPAAPTQHSFMTEEAQRRQWDRSSASHQ
jgi:hypothetical protein